MQPISCAAAASVDWIQWTRNLWFRKNVMAGGWSWAGDNERMKDRHELLVAIALAGWCWVFRRSARARLAAMIADRDALILCLALCASYSAALAYHTVQSQLAWGMPTTNPWYAAAALPSFMLLVAGGAFVWPLGRARFFLPLLLALHYLQVESSIILGSMTSLYAAQAEWTTALFRLAFLQPAVLGTTTLYAAIVATIVVSALALHEVFRLIAFDLVAKSAAPFGSRGMRWWESSSRRESSVVAIRDKSGQLGVAVTGV